MIYRIVLDGSALSAYAAGSVDVGELIAEIADEGMPFAVPVACLIDAMTVGADAHMLDLLTRHPWAHVLEPGSDWFRIGAAAALVGGHGRAVAALLQIDGEAGYIATCEPDAYGAGIKTIAVD